MKPKTKLIPIRELRLKIVLPGRPEPITSTGLDKLFQKLDIKPQRIKTGSYLVSHVTTEEADQVEAEFRRIHWKKFKPAP